MPNSFTINKLTLAHFSKLNFSTHMDLGIWWGDEAGSGRVSLQFPLRSVSHHRVRVTTSFGSKSQVTRNAAAQQEHGGHYFIADVGCYFQPALWGHMRVTEMTNKSLPQKIDRCKTNLPVVRVIFLETCHGKRAAHSFLSCTLSQQEPGFCRKSFRWNWTYRRRLSHVHQFLLCKIFFSF